MTSRLSICSHYNSGLSCCSSRSVLAAFASYPDEWSHVSSVCSELLNRTLCASVCEPSPHGVTSDHHNMVVCPWVCDALYMACRASLAPDQADALSFCESKLGFAVQEKSCWEPLPADPRETLVGGEALKPTVEWSSYSLKVDLRDGRQNSAWPRVDDRVEVTLQSGSRVTMERTTMSTSSSSSHVTNQWVGRVTMFQQRTDLLHVVVNGVEVLGSPFALNVQPSPRCVANDGKHPTLATPPSAKQACPAYARGPSCCPYNTATLLAPAMHHSSQTCKSLWSHVLCAAACDAHQASLVSVEAEDSLHVALTPQLCRSIRDACGMTHCKTQFPWPSEHSSKRVLHITVSGSAHAIGHAASHASPTHSTARWASASLLAGRLANATLVVADSLGNTMENAFQILGSSLHVSAVHLATGASFEMIHMGDMVWRTSRPLEKAGAYSLRARINDKNFGYPATLEREEAVLWVIADVPVIPAMSAHCPDRYGNPSAGGCEALKGIPSCPATRVSGSGLSIISASGTNGFIISECDAMQNSLLSRTLRFKVLVDNVVVPIERGGLVTYKTTSAQDSVSIHILCNGVPLPGSPWTAHRRKRHHVGMALRQIPPAPQGVTPISAIFNNLGTSIVVSYDGPTNTPDCFALTSVTISYCYWFQPDTLVFVLPRDATLVPGNVFPLNGGVLPQSNPGAPPTTDVGLTIQAPQISPVPVVSISAPSRPHGVLVLDASGSFNLGGRPAVWSWSVASADGAVPPALASFIALASTSRVGPMDVTLLGLMEKQYRFTATARTWLGTQSSSPPALVHWYPELSLVGPQTAKVDGPSVIVSSPAAVFLLRGDVGGEPSFSDAVDHAWFPQTGTPFVAPSIQRILADTKNLMLAPPDLKASTLPYLIGYSVTYNANSFGAGGSSVAIQVVPSLYPVNAGGPSGVAIRFPRSAPLLLNASTSVDPGTASQFSWVWNCSRIDFDGIVRSCFQQVADASILSGTNNPILIVPPGYLLPGTSQFTLVVTPLNVADLPYPYGPTPVALTASTHYGSVAVEAVLQEVPVVTILGPQFFLQSALRRLRLFGAAFDPYHEDPCQIVSYKWTSVPVLDLKNSAAGDSDINLQVEPGTLTTGVTYDFTLCATSVKGTGCATVTVEVNVPPTSGSCVATQLVVDSVQMTQSVEVFCEGWEDWPQQGPVQYWFYYDQMVPVSTGFSTANWIVAKFPLWVVNVTVVVQDSLGTATLPVQVPIQGQGGAAAVTVNAADAMAAYSRQDLVEQALAVCMEADATSTAQLQEMVTAYLGLRVQARSETMLSLLKCSYKLLISPYTGQTEALALIKNASYVVSRSTSAPVEEFDSTNRNLFQLAVNFAAYAMEMGRFASNDVTDALWELLAQLGVTINFLSVQDAKPEQYISNDQVLLVRSQSSGVSVPVRYTVLTNASALLSTTSSVQVPSSGVRSLLVYAHWNPAVGYVGVSCSPLIAVSLEPTIAPFSISSAFAEQTCDSTNVKPNSFYCASFVNHTWNSTFCTYSSNCSSIGINCCNCSSSLYPVALFADAFVTPVTPAVTVGTPTFVMTASNIAALIVLGILGLLGAALLALLAYRHFTADPASAGFVKVFSSPDFGFGQTDLDNMDMPNPPILRQAVSVSSSNVPGKALWWSPEYRSEL